jgi:hypothetical protein
VVVVVVVGGGGDWVGLDWIGGNGSCGGEWWTETAVVMERWSSTPEFRCPERRRRWP